MNDGFEDRAAAHAAVCRARAVCYSYRDGTSGTGMAQAWQYQMRFDVGDFATAEALRRRDPVLAPLLDVLAAHRAVAKCQFDAFADYVAAAEAQGGENHPLYAWTKAVIEDPARKQKYQKSFTLYVDGQEVYAREIADALEQGLRPLAASGLITRLSKYDTNPGNNPQPPRRSSEPG